MSDFIRLEETASSPGVSQTMPTTATSVTDCVKQCQGATSEKFVDVNRSNGVDDFKMMKDQMMEVQESLTLLRKEVKLLQNKPQTLPDSNVVVENTSVKGNGHSAVVPAFSRVPAAWTAADYESETISSSLTNPIKKDSKDLASTTVKTKSFPASQVQGLPLLPFLYTLQRLQQGASNGMVDFKELYKETIKLDSDFMTRIGVFSRDDYLTSAQQHLDLRVEEVKNDQVLVALRDVALPWLTAVKPTIGVLLEEKKFSPLAEILFCCNPTNSATLDYESLLKYLNPHAKLSLRNLADLDMYCKQASRVCNLIMIYKKKSFDIKLLNRMQPFKSEPYNREFFQRDFKQFYDLRQRLDKEAVSKKRARLDLEAAQKGYKKGKV